MPTIETGLLALALVAIGGFIAYLVWPPERRVSLQARRSSHGLSRRADWRQGLATITLNRLTNGFPTIPTANRPENGSIRSCLTTPKAGPRFLTSGLKISFSEPANDAERKFVIAHELATEAPPAGRTI